MADRVSASITLGGVLTTDQLSDLADLIRSEGLGLDWDEGSLAQEDIPLGIPLRLYAHGSGVGMLSRPRKMVPRCRLFLRPLVWSVSRRMGAMRVIFRGEGEPVAFAADEEDSILITRETVEQLGSIEAIRAHFDAAEYVVPPL